MLNVKGNMAHDPDPPDHAENHSNEILSLFPDSAANMLGRMILLILLAFVLAWAYAFAYDKSGDHWISAALGFPLLLFTYHEFRAGRIQRGLSVLCWTLWLFAALFGFIASGIRTPVLIMIPSLVMTIAWIQGKRSMLLMLFLSVCLLCGFVIAEQYHLLPQPHYRTPVQILIVDLAAVIFSGLVAQVLAENFRRLIDKGWRLTYELRSRVSALKTSQQALKELNEQLEQRVTGRTAQIDEANQSLQKLVARLERAQSELVNAEKLASLGSMVAGISHELNTPIGNVLMLTTSMENQYLAMIDKIDAGGIRRSELIDFMMTGHDMAVLATRSANRAVELVSSFKQVAVDQTSEQRRSFDLREVIEDNIATLWPSIKKRKAHLVIDNQVPAHIVCDSFPGPLGQVMINLMQNAILHGVANNDQGCITITALEQAEQVSLSVIDNGTGMPAHVLVHVFDPFFTTRLGKGGSGLGLSISYRIVTSVLGGQISAVSAPGQGAQFNLLFPKNAPYKL